MTVKAYRVIIDFSIGYIIFFGKTDAMKKVMYQTQIYTKDRIQRNICNYQKWSLHSNRAFLNYQRNSSPKSSIDRCANSRFD